MTPAQTRKHHFERLNNYRHSAEYAEYAKDIGDEVPAGDLPYLIGDRWKIDEATYDEFHGMLPPLAYRGNAFFMSEFCFGDVTTKYSKVGDDYYCEFARFPEKKLAPVQTPWGPSETSKEYAPGIVFYSTGSHGGFHLSDARVATMPKCLREFIPFGGKQSGPGMWLEEDCDWAVVALAFPHFFKPEELAHAMATIKSYKPELYEQVSAMKEGRSA